MFAAGNRMLVHFSLADWVREVLSLTATRL